MLVSYGGAYSIKIKFGDQVFDTWTDWHLIPASKPVIAPPQPNISMIAVPGRSSVIDTTELISGVETYGMRNGSWNFIIDPNNEIWDDSVECYNYLIRTIHGRSLPIQISGDDTWYSGRILVSDYKPEDNYSTITINYSIFYDDTSISPSIGGKQYRDADGIRY